MRFTRDQHLRKNSEFQLIRESGSQANCGAFVLRLFIRSSEDSAPAPRLGVIASKRVGNAVIRNRAKPDIFT